MAVRPPLRANRSQSVMCLVTAVVFGAWPVRSVAEGDEEAVMTSSVAADRWPIAERTRHRRARRPASTEERAARYLPFLREAAQVYRLPIALIWGVARVESAFEERARSSRGACGLMQMLPRTARSMGVISIYDPRQNILGGARYLRLLVNRWQGDLVLSVASYNAGQYAVERHLRQGSCVNVLGACVPPYRETMRYVQRVVRHYGSYREE